MKCAFGQNFDNVKIFTCIIFIDFGPVFVFIQREIIQIVNVRRLPTLGFPISSLIINTIATIVKQLVVMQMDLMCVANTQQVVIFYYNSYSGL